MRHPHLVPEFIEVVRQYVLLVVLAQVRDDSACVTETVVSVADGADEAFHAIQVVYRVRIVGGELRDEPDGSTDHAAWLSLDELPDVPLVRLAWDGVRLAFGVELATEPVP